MGGGGEPSGWLILPVLTLGERGDRGCTELPKEQDEERPRDPGTQRGPHRAQDWSSVLRSSATNGKSNCAS